MMGFKFLLVRCLAVVLVALTLLAPAQAQQDGGISVVATPLTLNGRTTYQYRVANNGTQRIVALAIGNDYRYGVPELTAYPEGWTLDTGIVPGTMLSPAGWSPTVLATEESAAVELRWRNDGSADVMPGQAIAGFAVVVPGQNALYLSSHWTAILGNGTVAFGLLAQAGQPRITLAMTALNQASPGRFTAQIEVANTGGATATEVAITKLIAKVLAGTGSVSVVDTSLPLQLGALAAGAKTTVNVTLAVSGTVRRISLTEQGVLKDGSGANLNFSAALSAYTKQ